MLLLGLSYRNVMVGSFVNNWWHFVWSLLLMVTVFLSSSSFRKQHWHWCYHSKNRSYHTDLSCLILWVLTNSMSWSISETCCFCESWFHEAETRACGFFCRLSILFCLSIQFYNKNKNKMILSPRIMRCGWCVETLFFDLRVNGEGGKATTNKVQPTSLFIWTA